MATLTTAVGALATLGAALLAACSGYEQSCELNPYACSEGGAPGTTSAPECGPCELDDGDGGCEPVQIVSEGACAEKYTCSPELECRKEVGESCSKAVHCATGFCEGSGNGECATCAADADCAEQPETPLCSGGWCRRPAGASCATDVACVTNRCVVGVCAGCTADVDCRSGQCDAGTQRCLGAAGEPCTLEADCASGQCSGGICIP